MLIKAKDVVEGKKIKPEELFDLYIFIEDQDPARMVLAVNILAKKGGYRVITSYSPLPGAQYVIMEKIDR